MQNSIFADSSDLCMASRFLQSRAVIDSKNAQHKKEGRMHTNDIRTSYSQSAKSSASLETKAATDRDLAADLWVF